MNDDSANHKNKGVGMNILGKIMTAIRVESRSLTEAVMDTAASNKFEQQLAAAKSSLQQAKSALTEEMALELQSSRVVKIIEDKINQQELLIVDCLSHADETKAFELATEMVELEQDLIAQNAIQHSHDLHLGHLKRHMEQAERSLKDLERQMSMVNTTERIQQATALITKNFDQADSKMLSAKQSLDRIRRKQKRIDDQYELPEPMVDNKSTEVLDGMNRHKIFDQAKDGAADVLKRIIEKE